MENESQGAKFPLVPRVVKESVNQFSHHYHVDCSSPFSLNHHSIFSPLSFLSSACVHLGLFGRLRLADLLVTRVVSDAHTLANKSVHFFFHFLSPFACSQANSNVTLVVFASGLSAAPVWQSSSRTLSINSQRPQCPTKHTTTPTGGSRKACAYIHGPHKALYN